LVQQARIGVLFLAHTPAPLTRISEHLDAEGIPLTRKTLVKVPMTRPFPASLLPLSTLLSITLIACQNVDPTSIALQTGPDEHSWAQPGQVSIHHLALDLALDFDTRTISGTATYTLNWKDLKINTLALDTRDLTINEVSAETATGWQALPFILDTADPILGARLLIQAPEHPEHIRVTYHTSPEASGLQWLTPEMTEGKQSPFMFSQSQAIHARSWVPLQDTPSVRFTYNARVTTSADVMVLMSADNAPDAARNGEYHFQMPQPVPSYLLAIAAGDLVFEPISERSGVWAEPAMVHKAAKEFADTEKMIAVAEGLYGPYRWQRYDLLVLPPSFPFGGMENPRLTFATPTVIVGDKSLVSLIAHELAHSWSGNLVTNASWKDIWLNEGFTTYVQSRIIEALYGVETAEMEREIEQTDLIADLKDMPEPDQRLALPPLPGRDPDDALTGVPYNKGAWFLQFLEQRFGRDTFDTFLRGWFDAHAFQSADTDQFVHYLKAHLLPANPSALTEQELHEWLYQPGIPSTAPPARSRFLAAVDNASRAFVEHGTMPDIRAAKEAWSTHEWVRFIDRLGQTLPLEQLAQLDDAFHFTGTSNGEIAMRWYPLTIRSGYPLAQDDAAQFIQRVGRRKLIVPIYSELVKTPDGLALAREILNKARAGYHPITTATVEKLITEASP